MLSKIKQHLQRKLRESMDYGEIARRAKAIRDQEDEAKGFRGQEQADSSYSTTKKQFGDWRDKVPGARKGDTVWIRDGHSPQGSRDHAPATVIGVRRHPYTGFPNEYVLELQRDANVGGWPSLKGDIKILTPNHVFHHEPGEREQYDDVDYKELDF